MSDVDDLSAQSAHRFAANLWGDEPSPLALATRDESESDLEHDDAPVDLDGPAAEDDPGLSPTGAPEDQPAAVSKNAGAWRTAAWLGSGVVLVAVFIVLVFSVFGGGPEPTPVPQHISPVSPVAVSPAPSTANVAVPQHDVAIPFAAKTSSCDEQGSTSPQALTDASSDSAWVCNRGPQESRLDGQILHVKFTCSTSRPESNCSYMLNSVSLSPGWLAKTTGGKDHWLEHRVVTNLQLNFFNGDQLAADPVPVDTHSVHGMVTVTLPQKVLASRVDVMILHTAPPPATPPAGVDPNVPGGGQDPFNPTGPVAGVGAAPDPTGGAPADPMGAPDANPGSDPVDATFAMSQMQFFGHAPN
ncbi:hypothetical protein [Mycobacterium sp. SMC-17]|uniref:hypothetical protein n=1 Tax=Mycobacterium sp. SMC-17 TaxID=3381628 RepID=UPI00387713FC